MIEIKLENLSALKRGFDPVRVEKAFHSALKKTGAKAKTHVSKEIRKVYNIKARDINQTAKVKNYGDIVELRWRGGPTGLDKFSPTKRVVKTRRGVRRGVAVKVKKRGPRRLVQGGFQPPSKGGLIFKRDGGRMASNPAKESISRMYSLSIPQMVNKEVSNRAIQFIGAEVNVQFERAFNFFLKVNSK